MKKSILYSALAALALNLLGSGALWAAANRPLAVLGDMAEGGPSVQKKIFEGGTPAAAAGSETVVPGTGQEPQQADLEARKERAISDLLTQKVPTPRVCKEKGVDCCGEHRPGGRQNGSYSSWKIGFTGWNIFGAVVGALAGAAVGFLLAGPVGAVVGGLAGAAVGGYLGGVIR